MTDPTPLDPAELLEHSDWMRRLAHRLVADAALADDVVQEAFVAALGTPPRAGVPLGPWLAAIVRNTAANLRRGRGRRATREAAVARPEAEPSLDQLVERAEGLAVVAQAVQRLPEAYREVVLLRYFDDAKPAAIAARLGLPVNTVRTRLARAHESLRDDLDRHFGGDGRRWALVLAPFAALDPRPAALSASSLTSTLGVLIVTHPLKAAAAATVLLALSALGLRALAVPAPMPTSPGGETLETLLAHLRSPSEEAPATPTAPRRAVDATRRVRGRVLDLAGRPVSATLVGCREGSRGYQGAVTDGDGQFEFELAEGDPWPRVAVDPHWVELLQRLDRPLVVLGSELSPARHYPIGPAPTAAPGAFLELVASPVGTARIEVRVRDRLGRPVPRFRIDCESILEDREGQDRTFEGLEALALDGDLADETEFVVGVPFRVRTEVLGREVGAPWIETLVQPVEGETIRVELEVDLDGPERAPGAVVAHGLVVSAADGRPIPGAQVQVHPLLEVTPERTQYGLEHRPVQSFADGSFTIAMGTGGPQAYLTVSHPHFLSAFVRHAGGAPTRVELEPRGRLTIRVVDGSGTPQAFAPLLVFQQSLDEDRFPDGGSWDSDAGPERWRLVTGPDGTATIEHLLGGSFLAHLLRRPLDADEQALRREFVRLDHGESREVVLTLPGAAEPVVTGSVVGAAPGPTPTVPFFVPIGEGGGWLAAEPDGLQYRAMGLEAGDYLVLLAPANDDHSDEMGAWILPRVTVRDAAHQVLDLAVPRGRAEGQVEGQGSDELRVVAVPEGLGGLAGTWLEQRRDVPGLPRAAVDANGRFTLQGCAAGPYRVLVLDRDGRERASRRVELSGSSTVALAPLVLETP